MKHLMPYLVISVVSFVIGFFYQTWKFKNKGKKKLSFTKIARGGSVIYRDPDLYDRKVMGWAHDEPPEYPSDIYDYHVSVDGRQLGVFIWHYGNWHRVHYEMNSAIVTHGGMMN